MRLSRAFLFWLLTVTAASAQNVLPSANWGDMLYRGQTNWMTVPPAVGPTDYTFLKSNGPNNAPSWITWTYPTQATNTVLGNVSGVNAAPIAISPTQFLDVVAYDVLKPQADPGTILYRGVGALGWQKLSPGTQGQVLTTGGLVNPPYWTTPASAGLDSFCTTWGAVLYRSEFQWVCLPPGSAGQFLRTNGASVDVSWATPPVYAPSIRVVTASGAVTISATDAIVVLNKSLTGATTVNLPAVATRANLVLEIYDWAGNAGDITINPSGAETIMGLSAWVVTSGGVPGSGGVIKLTPSTALTGWLVQ
jgi:hypothetical protein